jgi:hypothetical protein
MIAQKSNITTSDRNNLLREFGSGRSLGLKDLQKYWPNIEKAISRCRARIAKDTARDKNKSGRTMTQLSCSIQKNLYSIEHLTDREKKWLSLTLITSDIKNNRKKRMLGEEFLNRCIENFAAVSMAASIAAKALSRSRKIERSAASRLMDELYDFWGQTWGGPGIAPSDRKEKKNFEKFVLYAIQIATGHKLSNKSFEKVVKKFEAQPDEVSDASDEAEDLD